MARLGRQKTVDDGCGCNCSNATDDSVCECSFISIDADETESSEATVDTKENEKECSYISIDAGSRNSFHPRIGNPNLGIVRYDFTIQKGTDVEIPIFMLDGAEKPIDLTGYSAKCKIRKDVDAKPIDCLTTENRRILIDIENSTVTLVFPRSVTENYRLESVNVRSFSELGNVFLYDVCLTSSEGKVTCILKGTVRIVPQISR